jgi:hypothetical protein
MHCAVDVTCCTVGCWHKQSLFFALPFVLQHAHSSIQMLAALLKFYAQLLHACNAEHANPVFSWKCGLLANNSTNVADGA